MRIRIKFYICKTNSRYFFHNQKLQYIYPYASKKDLQATGRASNTSKLHFSTSFCGSFLPSWIQIRISKCGSGIWIQPTKVNADPCGSGSTTLLHRESYSKRYSDLFIIDRGSFTRFMASDFLSKSASPGLLTIPMAPFTTFRYLRC
jgi:hypothetical protein